MRVCIFLVVAAGQLGRCGTHIRVRLNCHLTGHGAIDSSGMQMLLQVYVVEW